MSSAADPTAAFLAAMRASKLLNDAQCRDLAGWAATTQPDAQALAKEVYRRGWLTPYQIREIAKGRGHELVLDRYILVDLLGEGGMGRVFKAHDTKLDRDVAVKIIRKERLKHPAAAARFDQEMKALGQLEHPNVVRAFDADHAGDTHFVVMEYIDGQDLTKLVRDHGPMPLPEACDAIRQAALGLHHAYEQGMVHRDIKPSNILIGRTSRQVKLVDLGLARLRETPGSEDAHRITQEGFVIGTPDFLAPEQARNPGAVDIRADIYALGATLYYILTGLVPYEGANPTEKMLKHCTDPPPSLIKARPDALPQIEQIIHWCMAKRPEDRPQSPLQLALSLQPFCQATTSTAHTVPASGRYPTLPSSGGSPEPATPGQSFSAPGFPAPASESQSFDVGPRSNDADPIRARAQTRGGFPVGLVLALGGGLLVVATLVGLYLAGVFNSGKAPEADSGPTEPFSSPVGLKMLRVEDGTFKMGSPETEPGRWADEGPVHEVTLAPFFMSDKEVTHSQWAKVMPAIRTPTIASAGSGSAVNRPVDGVSYDQAAEFCQKLTEREKKQPWARPGWAYRLPTEAEWEYACRAGTETPFGVGETGDTLLATNPPALLARYDATQDFLRLGLAARAIGENDRTSFPAAVGSYKPNKWGFYDMHGNVAEWCSDWYAKEYPGAAQNNPTGPATGGQRVVRGGHFQDPPDRCRSAARDKAQSATVPQTPIGFRVVYAPGPK